MGLAKDIKEEIVKAYEEGYKDGKLAGEVVSKWGFFIAGFLAAIGICCLIKMIFFYE